MLWHKATHHKSYQGQPSNPLSGGKFLVRLFCRKRVPKRPESKIQKQ